MPTIYLSLDGGLETFLKSPNQYFFLRSRSEVKLLEHALQRFQVCKLVHNVFLLVLSVSFDVTPEIIYKDFQIIKAFAQKCLEFLSSRQNQSFIIQLLLMLLLIETDAITKKICYKRYAVRSFCSCGSKMVFILLIKIIADHMVVNSINIRKTYSLSKRSQRPFVAANLASITVQMISCISSFE